MNKNIERDTYLQALALFTMAIQRYQELRAFEGALAKLLGVDDSGHISDAIYSEGDDPVEKRLNEALELEGISFTTDAQVD